MVMMDEVVCILICPHAFEKSMDLSILHTQQWESLGKVTALKEDKN